MCHAVSMAKCGQDVNPAGQVGSGMSLRFPTGADKWTAVPLTEMGKRVNDQVFLRGGKDG